MKQILWSIEKATRDILAGSVMPSKSGVKLYTPDGLSNYAALWTRDLAYMAEYAGDLIPSEDLCAAIEYAMDGAAKNGWIPDRVDVNGNVFYTAGFGAFPARPNLDTGTFLMIAADTYLSTLPAQEAQRQFARWKETLCRGIDCLPVDERGLIRNDAQPAHSPYGFTDCVRKTGLLSMETVILWRALKALTKWMGAEGNRYLIWQRSIEAHFREVFWDDRGMLRAATGLCNQIDVWASCYALAVDFPLSGEEKQAIAHWLIAHYDGIVQSGQVRHLPAGEQWESMLEDYEPGTYQNGAFWATASGWLAEALWPYDAQLAEKTLRDVLAYYEQYGVFECVNGDYRKLDTYVVSATNVYGICKKRGVGV